MPLISPSDDFTDDSSTSGRLSVGGQAQGHIDKGLVALWDRDWFKINLQQGTSYTFDLSGKQSGGGTLDTTVNCNITLNDSDGTFLGAALNGGPGGDPRMVYTATTSGVYYVGAFGAGAGSYTIKAAMSASVVQDDYGAEAGVRGLLEIGKQISGHLEYSQDLDWFGVFLKDGTTYDFELLGAHSLGSSAIAAPRLTILSAAGFNLSDATASGSTAADAHLQFTPFTTGYYYLEASDVQQGTGAYTIMASAQAYTDDYGDTMATAAPFAFSGPLGAQIKGTIGTLSDRDWFKVALHAGTTYAFSLLDNYNGGPGLNAALTIHNSDGSVLPGRIPFDPATTQFRPTTDGTYYLELAAPYSSTLGNYTLQAKEDFTFGNDILSGTAGNDTIDGDYGTDTVRYNGNSSHFTLSKIREGYSVIDTSGAEGSDILRNVERVQFADQSIALDINGVAGQAYRLYQAAFDRTPDSAGLGYWIATMDRGMSLNTVAKAFTESAEFKSIFGTTPSHDALVNGFYHNVLHREPDQAGQQYWVNAMDKGADAAAVLASFSESPENQAALATIIGNGISYTPYG